MMTDVKPARPARPSSQREVSASAPVAFQNAATVIPEDVPAPEVVSAPPAASAEPLPEVVAVQPAAVVQPALEIVPGAPDPLADSVDDAWTTFVEAQAVLVRGFEEIAVEVTGMTRSGIAAAADAGLALLGVRTFSEAVEINASLASRGVDAMIDGAAKLSEIGVKAMSEASRPILSRLGESWSGFAPG
jgi:Phasin protein